MEREELLEKLRKKDPAESYAAQVYEENILLTDLLDIQMCIRDSGTGLADQWPPRGMFPPGHGDYHKPDESISIKRIRKALLIYIFSIFELDKLKELK